MKPECSLNPFCEPSSLSRAQQERVHQNLGLIAVHLKRCARDGERPRTVTQRWDDLFQDGCLGLIQAAQTYQQRRGVPFQAFALAHIRRAVAEALRHGDSSVRTPRPRRRRDPDPRRAPNGSGRPHRAGETMSPVVWPCPPEVLDKFAAPEARTPDSDAPPAHPAEGAVTLAELVRAKIDAAVTAAAALEGRAGRKASGSAELTARLAAERLLAGDEEERASARQLGRQMGATYNRVLHCEVALLGRVRRTLAAEEEFQLLRHWVRRTSHGGTTPCDRELVGKLQRCAAEQWIRMYAGGSRERRAHLLLAVVEMTGFDVADLFRRQAARLTSAARTAWLAHNLDPPPG